MEIRRPPPLQWLPAFEAAGRLLSFKQAAAELFVTPSAVSQQIKLLESHLGIPLFIRRTRSIELTEAGAHYLPIVSDLLAQHRRGFSMLTNKCRGKCILRRLYILPPSAFCLLTSDF